MNLARARSSQRSPVALKVFFSSVAPSRVVNEIEMLAKVNSEEGRFVPTLLGAFRDQGCLTMVMSYFEHDNFDS